MIQAQTNSVDGIVRRTAARTPDVEALRFGERSWSYRELDAAVTAAAQWLLQQDLPPGAHIAAYGKNSDAYLLAFLACSRAGLVHVPINYALSGEELRYLLIQSESRAVLVDPELEPNLEAIRADTGDIVSLRLHGEASLLAASRHADNSGGDTPVLGTAGNSALLQLLYTSGTTSRPKGAMLSHAALIAEYVSCIQALDFSAQDKPLICMPLYHSAAMHVFLLPYLMVGASVVLLPGPDIDQILDRIEQDRIGSLFLAPTVWVPLANHPELDQRDLSSLTKAQYGASIMPVTVLNRLRERYPELGFYNCFGQSEIAPLATVLRPEEHEARPSSCGRPVLFVEARVVDAEGNDVAPDEQGEVIYRSPQLCQGYWKKPEETAAAFRDGWFHSGDLATRDAEGYITVVDRIKDVINTGGILVASREVEDVLYQHEAVAEVAVVGAPDDIWIEAITAFVVCRPGFEPTAEELIAHTRAHLAAFKLPKQIFFIDELPRNQSGKLLKRELRTRLQS
ncbi:MAG TPA: fatty acyl-CoA synthetase [Salinisphaeraceae bacterium]|nr:fatty acyl-CoA synthetase [Salinisphaeraceae bacterium]